MDATFLGIEQTADPALILLPVGAGLTGGKGQLFGGCLVGAATGLVEDLTERPAAWVTTQFASSATTGDTIALRAEIVAGGRSITQAIVHGTIDGRHHSTTLVATGTKSFPDGSPPPTMPEVLGPDDSLPLEFDHGRGGLNQRVDVRSADGPSEAPRTTSNLWFRFRGTTGGDPYSIPIAADFFPPALSASLGRRVFGASLDNTVRFVDRSDGEWLFIDMTVDSVQSGIAHGTNRVWSEDGRLLAIATQTCAVSDFS